MRDNVAAVRAVFIGGCGRSGTTMLGDLLGATERHVVTPETSYKFQLVGLGWGGSDGDLAAGTALITRSEKFGDLKVAMPALATPSLRALFEPLIAEYARATGKPNATVWLDHTPNNIGIGRCLLSEFEDSRIIHLVRDGRAVAASLSPLDWGPNSIIRIARLWTQQIAFGLALESAFPKRVTRVHYEQLLRSPRETIMSLCDFAELEFDDAMLRGGEMRIPSRQAGQFALVGKPPDPSRLEAWRTTLSPRDVEVFEAETGELLELLGYERVYRGRARRLSPAAAIWNDASDLLRHRTINRVRRWRRKR